MEENYTVERTESCIKVTFERPGFTQIQEYPLHYTEEQLEAEIKAVLNL